MRLSWLRPQEIRAARSALQARDPDWDAHFDPQFVPPEPPDDIDADAWPTIAEHVARAERVSAIVRADGLEAALAAYGRSDHAIEVATCIAAASQVDEITFDLLASLFACPVDEHVVYGTFLTLLVQTGAGADQVIPVYEQFCHAFSHADSDHPDFPARVAAVRDGLATLYVTYGRYDDADEMFNERHDEDRGDVAVALTAARSFLSAGNVSRAVQWLGIGADRARRLGRPRMEQQLLDKQKSLRTRMS